MKRIAWILLLAAAACGDANVAGNYTVAITNKGNGCSIGNWMVGAQPTAAATVLQEGSNVTLQVTGLAGIAVAALLGTNEFRGKVDGDEIDLTAIGLAAMSAGECTWTFNAAVVGTLDGDTLRGRIEYRAATNGHADCGTRTSCTSVQDFNATRPPP